MSAYAQSDKPSVSKNNQKMGSVLNLTQFTQLTSSGAGQYVYVTTLDRGYYRKNDDSGWIPSLQESSEYTSTPVTDNGTQNFATDSTLFTNSITLPTTEKLYRITHIEWKDGTTSFTVFGGVGIPDALPIVSGNTLVLALTRGASQSGVSGTVRKLDVGFSNFIRGGTVVYPFLTGTGGSWSIKVLTAQANQAYQVTNQTYSYPHIQGGGLGNQTVRPYIKVYYRGYS